MAKLRGSRLEAEIDKCRGECNWARLSDLLPSVRAKNSGVEKLAGLIEGEVSLELFLEKQKLTMGHVKPKPHLGDFLRTTEGMLKTAVAANRDRCPVHYFSSSFAHALEDLEKSQLDAAKTQFITLRSLKLAAEGYAIKGFATERLMADEQKSHEVSKKRLLSFFESAVELTISYINEFEKSVAGAPRPVSPSRCASSQLGDLLEAAMERAPELLLKRSAVDRKPDEEGVELYRKIMTELSDKSVVEHTQQRLCRQLAEILLRGSIDAGLAVRYGSRALNKKSEILNFYTGSNRNYYSPSSRVEEIVLLLLISEVIASRAMRSLVFEGESSQQERLMYNLKHVHNLLSVVLSHLRQHSLLSLLLDRSIQFAGLDRYIWRQFGLALACTGRGPRAVRIFGHALSLTGGGAEAEPEAADPADAQNQLVEHMQIARIEVEQGGSAQLAMKHAAEALRLCTDNALAGRCKLLFAMAFSMTVRTETSFERRRELLKESVENFREAQQFDPEDDLTSLFLALELAEARSLAEARLHCQQAIERNPYNVSAQMLMALLFTAKHDFKSAMRLVLKAAANFPAHYGLMVLKLRLEAKFGRVDRALKTSRGLLRFWQRVPDLYTEDDSGAAHSLYTHTAADGPAAAPPRTQPESTPKSTGLSSKEALAPMAPIFTAPLGIPTNALPSLAAASLNDISELASNTVATRLSEYGGAASTVSDSLGIGTSSSVAWSAVNTFRSRANIWVELAELLMDTNHLAEVQVCVEEACTLFPNSYQASYLKAEKMGAESELRKALHADARACFLAALAVHPLHVPSLQHLAHAYRMEGDLKMAEKMLRDAVLVEPLRECLWQQLGRVLAEQRAFDEANDCFRIAASVDSTVPLLPFDVIPRLLKSAF